MAFGLVRDSISIIRYMGMKPLLGMALPGIFTLVQLSGVWLNNVRRHEVNYGWNKFQHDEGIEADH
eukprot:CAMPEP_0115209670 /NCGR_PEP_ID=MMETSP0270-20121206/21854_1 /TAXON_ID=71861 /ORGANISM="Scrippsiella trochoidea, Strain CCMP3099" /LENGTH=65 /DNA_ID=CAMNT_0002623307 /DNA_START=44 /DNA_END=241 /DNA_ORIENTATION=+